MGWPLSEVDLASFALVAARVVGVVMGVPAFGGAVLPGPARIVLALLVAALVWPAVEPLAVSPSMGLLLVLLAKESIVGAGIGFLAALPFRAVESAGRLVDGLRGANLAELLSPELGARTSPTAELYLRIATLWFLAAGGYRVVLLGLADSFVRLPIGVGLGSATPAAFLETVLRATAGVLSGALSIALPALAALLLADLTIGAIGRAAPQLGTQAVLMPARALLGLAVTLLTLGGVLAVVSGF
jgi:type III secretion protein T